MTPPKEIGRVAAIVDAPDLSTFSWPEGMPEDLIQQDAQPPTSRIQVAKHGSFKHPLYGAFKVTDKTFDGFIQNFHAGIPTDRLPGDFDHEPDYGGKTKACGWVTGLEVDGQALYATVEWTWDGAWALREKTYRYVSPTWHMNWTDDAGERRGPTLIGFGLTNRPFFTRMAAVNLATRTFSRDDHIAVEDTDDTPEPPGGASDSRPRPMSTFATIAKQLGLHEDAAEADILTAARKLQDTAALAPSADSVVMTASQVADLTAKANLGEAAAVELKTMRFTAAFGKAVEEGRAKPAQEEHLRKIFAVDEDTAINLIASFERVVQITPRGGAGDKAADTPDTIDGTPVDQDAAQLHSRAVKVADERKISLRAAVALIESGEAA